MTKYRSEAPKWALNDKPLTIDLVLEGFRLSSSDPKSSCFLDLKVSFAIFGFKCATRGQKLRCHLQGQADFCNLHAYGA